MKIKKLGALLMLALSTLTFAACSSDDDNDGNQAKTYKYGVFVSDFEGTSEQMDKVNSAFESAFGATKGQTVYELTGTQNECDRKVKELAIKAGSQFSSEEDFHANIEVCNMNTDSTIYKQNIDAGANGVTSKGSIIVATNKSSVVFKNVRGKKLKLASTLSEKTVYDGEISGEELEVKINRSADGRYFVATVEKNSPFSVVLDK